MKFNLFKRKNLQKSASITDGSVGPETPSSKPVEKEESPMSQSETNSKEMKNENENKSQNQAEAATAESKTVHNIIILDESGSMSAIYKPALSGVNETLKTIRNAETEHENQKHFVSLIAFDSEHYNEIYNHVPAEKAIDITEEQYRPCGCTPLYDTMGRAISELRNKVKKEDTVLVTIITDGLENASHEYTGPAIKALVEALKGEGWVFTYIGANHDVEAFSKSLSINNSLSFDANENSTKEMFVKEMRSRRMFFCKLDVNVPKEDLNDNYFIDID